MKRSEINQAIRDMEELARMQGFSLPPFCRYTPEDWEHMDSTYDEIRDNMLGWDVTDYGEGEFKKIGLSLITIRNGNPKIKKYQKTYAEKLLMLYKGQYAPMHFHWTKMEDIVNRGGGDVLVRVFNSKKDEEIDYFSDVMVSSDGRNYSVAAGTQIRLKPGESISIYPYMYHDFSVAEGSESVLLGEISMSNDDNNDNRFNPLLKRFPKIEEDEKPYRLLCNEYPRKG